LTAIAFDGGTDAGADCTGRNGFARRERAGCNDQH
jgi:hypothetical protein